LTVLKQLWVNQALASQKVCGCWHQLKDYVVNWVLKMVEN